MKIKKLLFLKILLSFMLLTLMSVNVYANDKIDINDAIQKSGYQVFQNDNILEEFTSYKNALDYAKQWENTTIVYKGVLRHNFPDIKEVTVQESRGNSPLNLPVFEIYQNENKINQIESFDEACNYAKRYENSFVYGKIIIWDNYPKYYYYQGTERFTCKNIYEYLIIKKKNEITSPLYLSSTEEKIYELIKNCNHKIQNVKCIAQNPELPRGCEVTSLAMMLNYNGINVSKMQLANEVKKIPYKEDPNKGFIGNMYNMKQFGFGVYHSPITELAEKYAPGKVVDITGSDFEDIYYYILKNKPVWVINNTSFNALGESRFVYWDTPSGKVKITWSEHSVLVTGVDEKYVYINDPLTGTARKLNKNNFIKGWIQMGRQCVVVD